MKVSEIVDEPQSRIYEFGDFRVDAGKRLLVSHDGEAIPLTPKVFDTLLYLVEHHGTVLDKDELMRAIWPHTAVEENNLNQSVSALRRVLGESPGENRYIATVPGHGYRFVADVKKAAEAEPITERESSNAAAQSYQPADSRKSSFLFILLAGIGIVGLGFAIYYLWPAPDDNGINNARRYNGNPLYFAGQVNSGAAVQAFGGRPPG